MNFPNGVSDATLSTKPAPWTHGPLGASADGHYLQHRDGTPFFLLGDTAWELADLALAQEIDLYLDTRRQQEFNTILFVCYAELGGPDIPNTSGNCPCIGSDPARPNPAYFELVDRIIDTAAGHGMYVGMLPAWGSWVENGCLTPAKAEVYGQWLGERYRDRPNIIWVMGGDRHMAHNEVRTVWHRLARGVAIGINGSEDYRGICMSCHPRSRSSHAFHHAPWLTFNMMQSAHWKDRNLQLESGLLWDRFLQPAKPCMDAEPVYERMPFRFWAFPRDCDPATLERCDAYYVRKPRYTAMLSGGCGTVYGCNNIWQWHSPRQKPYLFPDMTAMQSLNLEGAQQMAILRHLFEKRCWHKIVPSTDWSNSIVLSGLDAEDHGHCAAATSTDRSFALVYSGEGVPVTVATNAVAGATYRASWFDPRTGAVHPAGEGATAAGGQRFLPPTCGPGNDWMLVIDGCDGITEPLRPWR